MLFKAGANVEYMYAFARQGQANAIMIFRFDNMDDAVKVLQANRVNVISGSDLYAL